MEDVDPYNKHRVKYLEECLAEAHEVIIGLTTELNGLRKFNKHRTNCTWCGAELVPGSTTCSKCNFRTKV